VDIPPLALLHFTDKGAFLVGRDTARTDSFS